ncbi:MFS transporter [Varibaculum cambriense]|uniref:uridine transporter UriT n=1 Tax=Varibaculum cambriense TaxID=184870 RepID=UPI0025879837|nr:MFS transporter [Varibaculum cambriense]MDU1223824.1 MFS transporter [Varibaculum cambriense]
MSKVRSVGAVMTALLVACFAFQLNASMLSPALVLMEKELNTTAAMIGLTQTVFFTAAALFSLFLPRLGDMIGRRKLLTSMMVLTAVGCVISALAGVTGSVALLFIGRTIQGVAGPTVPLCLIMLRVAVPDPKRYGTLMGVITAINGGIAGVDAIAGGWLAQNFGFESVFWTMAVIAVIAAFAVRFLTDESTIDQPQPMDWLGTFYLVVAVGSALIAINEIAKLQNANWLVVIGLIIAAAIFFMLFWRQEGNTEYPLVTRHYLSSRSTWALLLTTVLTMTGIFAIMNGIVPSIAQDTNFGAGLGADVVSFWTLTPYALAGLVMGPVAGTLAGRFGYRRVLRYGLIGALISLAILMFTMNGAAAWMLLVVSILAGLTYAGTVNIMLNGLGIVLSPSDNPGYLPGLNAGAFNLGAGISFAVLYAVMTSLGGGYGGHLGAIITGAILLLLALGTSFLIPKAAGQPAAAS